MSLIMTKLREHEELIMQAGSYEVDGNSELVGVTNVTGSLVGMVGSASADDDSCVDMWGNLMPNGDPVAATLWGDDS